MESIIKVENLKPNYGSVQAVKGISFRVEKGSLFAFLGTNGAGKSTTINILSTLLKMDGGKVTINGMDMGKHDQQIRKDIGIVFQNGVLDNLLSVKENLMVRGSFYGIEKNTLRERIEKAIDITECHDFLNRKYGKLSGGQKRRADIARALIHQPKILFLDEPTTGLDPKTRQAIWKAIEKMQKEYKMTVFLTTHYMEEAANADLINIINNGEIIAAGTPHQLKEKYTYDVLRIYEPDDDIRTYIERENKEHKLEKNVLNVVIRSAEEAIGILTDIRNDVRSFEVIHGNMDDVFLNAVNASKEG